MEKKKFTALIRLFIITCFALVNAGCTYTVSMATARSYRTVQAYEKVEHKGYLFEIGEVAAGDTNTASYLPERIEFELIKKLRQKDLLATSPESEKRLIVNIETFASYSPFAKKDAYDEILSRVIVTGTEGRDIIAETTIRSINAFGWTGDFTEITHAGQITSFIESVVR